MSVPSEFLSDLVATNTQRAGAYIVVPRTATARNVFTKLDDLGFQSDMIRQQGESQVNFRAKVHQAQVRRGSASNLGLTDAIATELGLGHATLLTVTVDRDVKLDVTQTQMSVVASGVDHTINLVNYDADGVWVFPEVHEVVAILNTLSGVTASSTAAMSGLPGMLLEPQSSYVPVDNEQIPNLKLFQLGLAARGEELPGTIVSGTLAFSDQDKFRQLVDTPSAIGEFSLEPTTGRVEVYDPSDDLTFATYSYNLLVSGQSMKLIGNGVKVFNAADIEVQHLMFTLSGIGYTAQEVTYELRKADRAFWGK